MSGRTATLTLRASLILTSSFVASTAVTLPQGVTSGVFTVTYTRGAAGGYPSILVEQSDDGFTTVSPLTIFDATITQANELGATNGLEWVWNPFGTTGPAAGTATPLAPLVPIAPLAQMRVRCKETGIVLTPGTLAITFVGIVG